MKQHLESLYRLNNDELKIGCRKSPLSIIQAHKACDAILSKYTKSKLKICPSLSEGDKSKAPYLHEIGGKELFASNLHKKLLNDEIQIAVHSLKDLGSPLPAELEIAFVIDRESPADRFISQNIDSIRQLNKNHIFASSSLRRQYQAKNLCQNVIIQPLRGNINSRINKIITKQIDATIIAEVAYLRLIDQLPELQQLKSEKLNIDIWPPALCQGFIAVVINKKQKHLLKELRAIYLEDVKLVAKAERLFLKAFSGSCHTPLAGFAEIKANKLHLSVSYLFDNGSSVSVASFAPKSDAFDMAKKLAVELKNKANL